METQIKKHMDVTPIFIIGCARSGTSAMVNALNAAEIKGYGEGHVAHMLHGLYQAVDHHLNDFSPEYLNNPKHLISHFSSKSLKGHIANFFGDFFIEEMGKGMWLDKSPFGEKMIHSCPTLLEIFPNAKFIFCKRRGIENILSHQRKFGADRFENYCKHWASTMLAWKDMRKRLGEAYIEIDQRDMALHPEQTAAFISGLLGLKEASEKAIAHSFATQRVQQTRAAQDHIEVDIDLSGWNEAQKTFFRTHCGAMMQAYGYKEKMHSSAEVLPIRLFYPVDGNAGIEKRNVIGEPWGFSAVDATTIQLHPNPPSGHRAEVSYLDIALNGQSRFHAVLQVPNAQAEPVQFSLRIQGKDAEAPLFEKSIVVNPVDSVDWDVRFPPLYGVYNITIATAMASGAKSERHAWARWKQPELA